MRMDNSVVYEVALSGSDPVGVLYSNGNCYLRAVSSEKEKECREMIESGFISALMDKGLIPETSLLKKDEIPPQLSNFKLVLVHRAISPVIYPREMSFEMIRSAILCFFDVVEVALSYGYVCKDSHLFNIVFDGTKPVWVDIGSFEKKKGEKSQLPWLESFLAGTLFPVKMWADCSEFMASRLLSSPTENLSSNEALLYQYCMLRGSSKYKQKIRKIFLRAFSIVKKNNAKNPGNYLLSLKKQVSTMKCCDQSAWGNYHNEYFDNNGKIKKDTRFTRISELLENYSPKSILELAGNAGIFSEIIRNKFKDIRVICTDYDSKAIDSMYKRVVKAKGENFFCAKLNFMETEYSSAEIFPDKRFKSDCVFALAITHHLLLMQKYTYDQVFKTINAYSSRLVFIEFMPLGLWSGNSSLPLPDWYSQQSFEKAFCNYFDLELIEPLEVNRVLFIGRVR